MDRITSPLEGEVETAGNRPGVEGGGGYTNSPAPGFASAVTGHIQADLTATTALWPNPRLVLARRIWPR